MDEIKKVSLAGLICNNYDLFKIKTNPFKNESPNNTIVDCLKLTNQIAKLNPPPVNLCKGAET